MEFKDVKIGQLVKSVYRPMLTFEILEIKRGGWIVIQPIDEGFTDIELTVRARILFNIED